MTGAAFFMDLPKSLILWREREREREREEKAECN
jgi:hypothetical protein